MSRILTNSTEITIIAKAVSRANNSAAASCPGRAKTINEKNTLSHKASPLSLNRAPRAKKEEARAIPAPPNACRIAAQKTVRATGVGAVARDIENVFYAYCLLLANSISK